MDEVNEDPAYMKMRKGFSTSIVDVFENFYRADGTMVTKQSSTKERVVLLLRTIVNPRRSLTTAGLELFAPFRLSVISFGCGLVYFMWILLLALSPLDKGTATLAWLMYLIFVSITASVRYNLRKKWYIIGNLMDDVFVCFFFYPFALAQMQLEVESHTGRPIECGRSGLVSSTNKLEADEN
jgi:hypothetical protein